MITLVRQKAFYFESVNGNPVFTNSATVGASVNGKLTKGEKFSAGILLKSMHSYSLTHGKPSCIEGRGLYLQHRYVQFDSNWLPVGKFANRPASNFLEVAFSLAAAICFEAERWKQVGDHLCKKKKKKKKDHFIK